MPVFGVYARAALSAAANPESRSTRLLSVSLKSIYASLFFYLTLMLDRASIWSL